MAPQTLLRFNNCSSSYCLLSPCRRFHLFESSCPSLVSSYCFLRGTPGLSSCREIFFRYNLFLEASQWACFVVTSFSCPYFFGSSFRRPSCIHDSNKLSQLFPPWLHEAYTGQNNMAKIAKIENKSEEQQPSTPKGGFRGWPRGPRSPLFLWNFVLFLWNALKHKKYLYSWQVSRPSLSEFSGSAPASPFASTRSFANAVEKDLKQVNIRVIFIINRL